jgi:hypothetical protein
MSGSNITWVLTDFVHFLFRNFHFTTILRVSVVLLRHHQGVETVVVDTRALRSDLTAELAGWLTE